MAEREVGAVSITLIRDELLGRTWSGWDYLVHYSYVPSQFVGTPEESAETNQGFVHLKFSRSLAAVWQYSEGELLKVFYEYAKRRIIAKAEEGDLGGSSKLELLTETAPPRRPFDPSRITVEFGKPFIVRLPMTSMDATREPGSLPSRATELEQKFRIVRSWPQAGRDFAAWRSEGVTSGSILFLDIDFFKMLNSRHTNEIVDRDVLRPFQEVLLGLCAGRGEVYRHGGDEFVILLPNQSSEDARTVAERLRSALRTRSFVVSGTEERVRVSVGVACWPEHGRDLSEVTVAATKIQVFAKEEGRDRVVVFGERKGEEDAVRASRHAQEVLKAQADRRRLLEEDGPRAANQESQALFAEIRRLATKIERESPTLQLRGEYQDHSCRLTTGAASAELHTHFAHPVDQSMITMTRWLGRLRFRRTLAPRKEPEEVGRTRLNFDHQLGNGWCWRTRAKPRLYFTSGALADHLMQKFVAFALRIAARERDD